MSNISINFTYKDFYSHVKEEINTEWHQ